MIEKRTKLVIGIIFTFLFVLIVSAVLYLYLNNSLAVIGLCKPGYKSDEPFHRFCYKPSGFDGQTCYKASDCPKDIGCIVYMGMISDEILKDPSLNELKVRGVCSDVVNGCFIPKDKEGNLKKFGFRGERTWMCSN